MGIIFTTTYSTGTYYNPLMEIFFTGRYYNSILFFVETFMICFIYLTFITMIFLMGILIFSIYTPLILFIFNAIVFTIKSSCNKIFSPERKKVSTSKNDRDIKKN